MQWEAEGEGGGYGGDTEHERDDGEQEESVEGGAEDDEEQDAIADPTMRVHIGRLGFQGTEEDLRVRNEALLRQAMPKKIRRERKLMPGAWRAGEGDREKTWMKLDPQQQRDLFRELASQEEVAKLGHLVEGMNTAQPRSLFPTPDGSNYNRKRVCRGDRNDTLKEVQHRERLWGMPQRRRWTEFAALCRHLCVQIEGATWTRKGSVEQGRKTLVEGSWVPW